MRCFLLFCCVSYVLCDTPWYLPIIDFFEPTMAKELRVIINETCETQCSTTMDCPTGLSCFHASTEQKGCCLMALKPNETGCVLDDQCKRACESTICDKTQQPSRCLCEKGRHFLFNKCWKQCPEFAFEKAVVDERGFSRCQLKNDLKTAVNYLKRNKRQLRNNFC